MTWIAPALAFALVIAHQIAYGSADAADGRSASASWSTRRSAG
jgi:hypothetical protein